MQNSLFRRRLAIRACFDVLLEYELVAAPSPPTTTDNSTASLLTRRTFVLFEKFYFKTKFLFQISYNCSNTSRKTCYIRFKST